MVRVDSRRSLGMTKKPRNNDGGVEGCKFITKNNNNSKINIYTYL
ncbi:MAG: hypothetical protein SFT68_03940 [Rickettsiaceae bacterium]|nr:hypothetical protein [Rickettsiaceae bacterium]